MRDDIRLVAQIAVTTEPIRYVTEHFIQTTSEKRNATQPMLFQMTDPQRSPVRVSLMHCAELLSGRASRLQLVWRPGGWDSLASWAVANPVDAKRLRDFDGAAAPRGFGRPQAQRGEPCGDSEPVLIHPRGQQSVDLLRALGSAPLVAQITRRAPLPQNGMLDVPNCAAV